MATLYFRGLVSAGDNWNSNKWSLSVSITPGTLPPPGPLDIAIIDSNSGIGATTPLPVISNVTIGGLELTNTISAVTVLTLNANMQINGDFNLASQGNTILGNGFTISVGNNATNSNFLRLGSNTLGLNNGSLSTGTLTLRLNGTGLQVLKTNAGVGSGSVGYFTLKGVTNNVPKRLIFEIDKPSGIVTFNGGNGLLIQYCEFKYTNIATPSNITGLLTAENSTINSGPIVFQSLQVRFTNSIETTNTITNELSTDQNDATIISSSGKGIKVNGNLSLGTTIPSIGSIITTSAAPSFIEFIGTTNSNIFFSNPNSVQQYIGTNIRFSKTSPAKVTLPSIMYFGNQNANTSWTHTSGVVDGTNCTLHIKSNAPNITFDTNGITTVLNKLVFDKSISPPVGINHSVTLNSLFKFTGTLEIQNISGNSTTFLGTSGFDITNFTATSGTVTLKAGNTYKITNGVFTLSGTAATRTILKSDTSVIATGSITGNTLTFTSATSLAGYRVSQAYTNSALLRRLPSGLIFPPMDVTTPAFLAQVTGGSGSTWTLNKTSIAGVTSRGLMLGLPAFLEVTNCTYSIDYVTTFDIDSSGADKILANNSYQNRVGIPSPNLWRTVNWDSLNPLLPLVLAAYVE
jgi:hypothetical protein